MTAQTNPNTTQMIIEVKEQFGHVAHCRCKTCHYIDTNFQNTSAVIHATNRALADMGITEVAGRDIAFPALKLFLQRNYNKQVVRPTS